MADRPRKPHELKVLEGTFRPDRDGDPATVPASGSPAPPAHLKGEALAFWKSVVPGLIEAGVAKERDAAELAGMCEWWARYRRFSRQLDRAKGTAKNLQAMVVRAGISWDKFASIACRFGLTPADRAKLRADLTPKKPGVAARRRTS